MIVGSCRGTSPNCNLVAVAIQTAPEPKVGRALVKDLQYRLDVNTLHRDKETRDLGLNEIGPVQLRTTVPLPLGAKLAGTVDASMGLVFR